MYAPQVRPLNFQGASHAWPHTRPWPEQYNHCGFLASTRDVSASVGFNLEKHNPLNLESSGCVVLWLVPSPLGFILVLLFSRYLSHPRTCCIDLLQPPHTTLHQDVRNPGTGRHDHGAGRPRLSLEQNPCRRASNRSGLQP